VSGAAPAPGNTVSINQQTVYANGFPTWQYALLKTLGAPVDDVRLQALNLWARAEGMPGGTNNWLAITDPNQEFGPTGSTGAVSKFGLPGQDISKGLWNKTGVASFASLSSGVNATASFLMHGHSGVLAALRDPNATVDSIGSAIAQDGAWGGDGAFIIANSGTGANGSPLSTTPYVNGDTSTGPTAGDAGTGGNSSFTNCNSSNTIIGGGGLGVHFTLLNPCQAKALVGGLLVGLGASVTALGIFLIATRGYETSGLQQSTKAVIPAAKVVRKAAGNVQRRVLGR